MAPSGMIDPSGRQVRQGVISYGLIRTARNPRGRRFKVFKNITHRFDPRTSTRGSFVENQTDAESADPTRSRWRKRSVLPTRATC